MTLPPWTQVLVAQLTSFGLKLLGAIVIWIVGRRLIGLAVRVTAAAIRRQSLDETLVGYILLDVILIVAIVGFFGVETTTFAALLAGIGIAIGTAWAASSGTSRPACSSSGSGRFASATSSPPAA